MLAQVMYSGVTSIALHTNACYRAAIEYLSYKHLVALTVEDITLHAQNSS